MSRWFIGWLSIVTASAAAQGIELPNEFEAGQPARAAEVNANFETLRDAVNENASRLTELVVRGLPAEISELVRLLAEGRRFNEAAATSGQ